MGGSFRLGRRGMVKSAMAMGVISPAFAAWPQAQASAATGAARQGAFLVTERGPVRVHSLVSPESSALVTSHVIETERALTIVDSQFARSLAGRLRAYAEGLGKPIARIVLSHPHPDHFSGYASAFAGVDFISTPAIAEAVQKRWVEPGRIGGIKKMLGEEAPERFIVPEPGLATGVADWDGVTVEITEHLDAEAVAQITIRIPDAGVLIAQDLIYANAHFFPLGNNPNWVAVLKGLRRQDDVDLILAGHGYPAGRGVLDNAIAYLEFLEALLGEKENAAEVVASLTERYPAYGGLRLLDFVERRFKKVD